MDLYRFMSVLIDQPGLALAPGLLLLLAASIARSRGAALCGGAWILYCVYEYGMKLRLLCTGECNIRIDLLAIYPALLAISALGIVLVVRASIRRFNA